MDSTIYIFTALALGLSVYKSKQKTKLITSQLKKVLLESANFCKRNCLTEESRCKEVSMKM